MINPKAYTEVYEIIKHMPKYMKEKIPKNLIQSIEENMDKNYKVDVEDLEECELLEDTEKLLSVIYCFSKSITRNILHMDIAGLMPRSA